jgi:hypothetical protein
MKHIFQRAKDYFTSKPKVLFLIDAMGAALTTCSLFFPLRHFNQYFGMPLNILTNLSILGLAFCVYSWSCYFYLKDNWSPYIRTIAIANLLYCVLTVTLMFFNYNNLTPLGLAYFIGESTIILSLVYVEFRVAGELKKEIS